MPDLVVLIATRNRWQSLRVCLDSLQAQDLPPLLEVIVRVVDNGSTDGSARHLREYAASARLPVEVLSQPRAGKSAALNLGLRDLKCEVVAFTDDDMRLDPQWIAAIWSHFRGCDCVGINGRVALELEGSVPSWFTDRCAGLLGSIHRSASDPVTCLQGANMAVRAAVIERIGLFREDLGPVGQRYGSAEDIEWSGRLHRLGERLCYCPDVLNYHRVGRDRVSRLALWVRQFEFARRDVVEALEPVPVVAMSDSKRLIKEARGVLGALLVRKRTFSGFDYALEIAQRCGHLAGLLDRIRCGRQHLASGNQKLGSCCPLCGRIRPFSYMVGDLNGGLSSDSFEFRTCKTCGVGWITPLPSVSQLIDAYGESGPTPHQQADDLTRLARIRKYEDGGRLLDIGCGDGQFLEAALRAGFVAEGLDFDSRRVERINERGLAATCATLADFRPNAEPYDVVTLWHVIEHLPDTVEVLRKVRELLRPGGILGLATPNLDSLQRKLFKSRWYHHDVPRHLFLFSAKGLCTVLAREGLEVLGLFWGSAEHDWAGIQFTVDHNLIPGGALWERALRRLTRQVARPLASLEARLGVGATFEIYARRV